MKKILICPICGSKEIGWEHKVVDFEVVATKENVCFKCKQEVIPLVTPQEER